MMQRKDISKYIYKYFIEKDEKENFVKDIVKWGVFFNNRYYTIICNNIDIHIAFIKKHLIC
jgi:hypothetical protein